MLPRELRGRPKNTANARHGYGFRLLIGERKCAYCGTDLTNCYESWLRMSVDHVVPLKVCENFGVPRELSRDYANLVLACAACNGFANRYRPDFDIARPITPKAFFDFRDRVFGERRELIANKHRDEISFFKSKVLPRLKPDGMN
jgi:hypothetical protein